MNLRDRIFQSATFSIIGRIVTLGIAFLITPFMMEVLGHEVYGLWLLIIAIIGWFRIADLGFSTAVQRSIAIAIEHQDNDKINAIFSCAVVLFSLLGLLAASIVVSLSFFPSLLGVEDQYFSTVKISLSILSVKIFWDIGMSCFHGFYSALIRYDIDANINTANDLIKACLIFLFLRDLNIYGAVVATMASDFITNLFKAYYSRVLCPTFRFETRLVSMCEFKKLFDYSKHVLALVVANSFSKASDAFIISHLLGLGVVATYGVAARLVYMIEDAILTVLGLFLPVLTRLIEKRGEVETEVNQVFSLNFLLISSFFIPLIVFSEDFITLWLGEGFNQSRIIVAAIAISLLCKTVSRPIQMLLLAQATHSELSVVRLSQVTLNVMLSVYLGLKFGVVGILFATVVSSFFCDVFLHLVLYRRYTDYAVGIVVSKFFLSAAVVSILSSIGIFHLNSIPPLTWLGMLVYSTAAFIISFALVWIVVIDRSTKSLIVSIVASNLTRYKFWSQ